MPDKAAVQANVYLEDTPKNIDELLAAGADVIIFENSTNLATPVQADGERIGDVASRLVNTRIAGADRVCVRLACSHELAPGLEPPVERIVRARRLQGSEIADISPSPSVMISTRRARSSKLGDGGSGGGLLSFASDSVQTPFARDASSESKNSSWVCVAYAQKPAAVTTLAKPTVNHLATNVRDGGLILQVIGGATAIPERRFRPPPGEPDVNGVGAGLPMPSPLGGSRLARVELRTPQPRPESLPCPPEETRVRRREVLGGLIHEYELAA
jgi:hypothetical protein